MRFLVLIVALVFGTFASNAFGQCSNGVCRTPVKNTVKAAVSTPVVVADAVVTDVVNTLHVSKNVVVNTVQTSRNVTKRVVRTPVRVIRAVRFCR